MAIMTRSSRLPPQRQEHRAARGALLDVMQISDILSVESAETFTRPIYAGNAIATVKVERRQAGHHRARHRVCQGSEGPAVRAASKRFRSTGDGPVQLCRRGIAKSERPELTSAKIIVSGGRALKDGDVRTASIFPLADKLGAAVGASRAAVDAGYVPNDYQVGQTGKIVAPKSTSRSASRARSSTLPA
jgi:electron transfer flavoprotein alpha subunit